MNDGSVRLGAPIGEVASDLLDRDLRQVRKRGRCLRQAGVEQRHRLRIALKKLRYSIDFLRSLFGERQGRSVHAPSEAHARRARRRE